VKAMLETLPGMPPEQHPRSVTVLWGGREERDLYMDPGALAGHHRLVPVLSRPADNWSGARGHVQDVLLETSMALSNAVVYACGSNEMIRDARNVLVDAGLSSRRFHADAFVCSAPRSSAEEHRV
jgi:CDP-4-dehydro-6-deoxyglucose reductase, E3